MNGLEEKYSGDLTFEKLDASARVNMALQLQYGVRGHPTFVLLDNNNEVSRTFVGPQTEETLRDAVTTIISNEQ